MRGSARVYLEAYTSLLLVPKERLEDFYGKEVIVADREMVEMVSLAAVAVGSAAVVFTQGQPASCC